MNTINNPQQIIDNSPMSRMQIFVVALLVTLCALDGFDLLSISFAAPGIAEEWGINRAQIGIVLSMEFVGLAVGAIFMGALADKFGRRFSILLCLVFMAIGMLMSAVARDVVSLSLWRIFTGLGIGGVLSSANAMAAEFSNTKTRHMSCSLAVTGVPLGGVIGGTIASLLLAYFDWRAVFYFGSIITALCIPLVYFYLPESIHWLGHRQPPKALDKINHTLKRAGHQLMDQLPNKPQTEDSLPLSEIFRPDLVRKTVLVTLLFFLHVATFYFMMKWIPKIVVDMGFNSALAGSVLVWTNIGGVLGGSTFGILARHLGLRRLMMGGLLLSAVFVAWFGQAPADIKSLSILCGIAGFFTMATMCGMYALMAHVFPVRVRAVGTGFGIGVGRGGSIISPILAGVLFTAGLSLPVVAILMAVGSFLAIGVLRMIPMDEKGASESEA